MIDKKRKAGSDRREFLKMAGLGGIAGGAALVAGKPAEAAENVSPREGAGYRETEHVKAFYKSMRF
jgi:hypothetical protein